MTMEIIIKTVREFHTSYTYVFTTGGIGPTHDDITSESVAKVFNKNYIIEFGSKSLVISPKNKIIMDGFAGREDSFKGINLDIFE